MGIGITRDEFGGLVIVWSWFDTHTEDELMEEHAEEIAKLEATIARLEKERDEAVACVKRGLSDTRPGYRSEEVAGE